MVSITCHVQVMYLFSYISSVAHWLKKIFQYLVNHRSKYCRAYLVPVSWWWKKNQCQTTFRKKRKHNYTNCKLCNKKQPLVKFENDHKHNFTTALYDCMIVLSKKLINVRCLSLTHLLSKWNQRLQQWLLLTTA